MEALREAQTDDVAVVVGGTIAESEISLLKGSGVVAVFHPGSSRDDIVRQISSLLFKRRRESQVWI